MQNDNMQGILFDKDNLLDLTRKSRRQKVLLRINTSKKALHKLLVSHSSTQTYVKGPTYMRNRHAVITSADDRESAITDLMDRFNI